jgi:hypothetical protein
MDRLLISLIGAGLIIFGVILVGAPGVPIWMIWVDIAGSLCAFVFAISERRRGHRASPLPLVALFIAIGLSVVWILGLATHVAPWATWTNFVFAICSLCVSIILSLGWFKGGLKNFEPMFPLGAASPFHWSLFSGVPFDPYVPLFPNGGSGRNKGAKHFAGVGPRLYRRSDAQITEDINSRLTSHWEVDATDIYVECQHGNVTLSGSVPNRRARRIAEEIVEAVPGVHELFNQLRTSVLGGHSSEERPPIRVA